MALEMQNTGYSAQANDSRTDMAAALVNHMAWVIEQETHMSRNAAHTLVRKALGQLGIEEGAVRPGQLRAVADSLAQQMSGDARRTREVETVCDTIMKLGRSRGYQDSVLKLEQLRQLMERYLSPTLVRASLHSCLAKHRDVIEDPAVCLEKVTSEVMVGLRVFCSEDRLSDLMVGMVEIMD